jgi:signal transduction histidine kinase
VSLSFSQRIAVVFAALLAGFSVLVLALGLRAAGEHEREVLQRLSHGLALHIVDHWPEVARSADEPGLRAALDEILHMLMTVNPAIEVYVLGEDGEVRAFAGDAQAVKAASVDLSPIRDFLAGGALPILGTDPREPGVGKIFSAARFGSGVTASDQRGYLYVVLDGQARAHVASRTVPRRFTVTLAALAAAALALTLFVGAVGFRKLTRPLRQIAREMRAFTLHDRGQPVTGGDTGPDRRDEIVAIASAFDEMVQRIQAQTRADAEREAAHRELTANIAHDLRTPLTAMHGYLERLAKADPPGIPPDERRRCLDAALAQSNKVRRLSQQLFELARLQAVSVPLQIDRFRVDELVHDTVQKFALAASSAPVTLAGLPPPPVEMEGDIDLIDRALVNLIDNAIRHSPPGAPVRVSLLKKGAGVAIFVEDAGPGLPEDVAAQFRGEGASGSPGAARPGGGLGGLGLAIVRRIAALHGGGLRLLPSQCGTRFLLTLPVARKAAAPA